MAACEEDKLLPRSPTESAPAVSENHSHVSSSSYSIIDPFTDQSLDQSLVQDFQRVTVDIEENNNAVKNNTLEQDCFFHRTGSCKFGANCKFHHSEKKAYQVPKGYRFLFFFFVLEFVIFCCFCGLWECGFDLAFLFYLCFFFS